jgi:predicted dehydrogenase
MDNARPKSVRAVTQNLQPNVYPKVDDEANILVEYDRAIGIIEGSWNWPFSRKDMDVYGETGYVKALNGQKMAIRLAKQQEKAHEGTPWPSPETDSVSYLRAIARNEVKPSGLSSLENNMIVTEILSAARESARTGNAVKLA